MRHFCCNSLAGEQQGHSQILYQNTNLKFYYMAQPFMLYGVLLGQRSVNCHKRSYCFQPENQLLAEITFNPKDKNSSFFSSSSQKIDGLIGKICKVTPECIQKCLKAHIEYYLFIQLQNKFWNQIENFTQRYFRYLQYQYKRKMDILFIN